LAHVARRHLARLQQAPANLADFVAELSEGVGAVFGRRAALAYRAAAPYGLRRSLAAPETLALGIVSGADARALAVSRLKGRAAEISLVHVLRAESGRGHEYRLLEETVRTWRAGGAEGIVLDFLPLGPLDLEGAMRPLGFTPVPRALMAADTARVAAIEAPHACAPATDDDLPALGAVLAEAYRDHPETRLHLDVSTAADAQAFIEAIRGGAHGAHGPGFTQVARTPEGEVAGLAAGVVSAPGTGFVLQVAVAPRHHRRGYGASLLNRLARAFSAEGLTRMALGVSVDNPARRLYERAGFTTLAPVTAWTWWHGEPTTRKESRP
jgi:ribosomal protein S18 acetylase RimI-like enzyme